ncbi:MAG: hypothetical protein ACE366_23120 [Bradymonadia bacterium]
MWQITHFSRPHKGEDVAHGLKLSPNRWGVVLADGAGGLSGGWRAAARTVDTLIGQLEDDPANTATGIARWMETVDNALVKDKKAGEAAAITLVVDEQGVRGAQAGNVAAWAMANGQVTRLDVTDRKIPRLGTKLCLPAPLSLSGHIDAVLLLSAGAWGPLGGELTQAVAAALSQALEGDASTALPTLVRAGSDDSTGILLVRR